MTIDGGPVIGARPARLAAALAAIDAVNAGDPNLVGGRPRALVQGELASAELEGLVDDPTEALQLAARAHHLKRWELPRDTYPTGRAGYLRWRRDNKANQAEEAATLLAERGYGADVIERVGELLSRRRLTSDPDTQALEDVACLAFLQTELDDLLDRLGHERLVDIAGKTLAKMSGPAIDRASALAYSPRARAVIDEATLTH